MRLANPLTFWRRRPGIESPAWFSKRAEVRYLPWCQPASAGFLSQTSVSTDGDTARQPRPARIWILLSLFLLGLLTACQTNNEPPPLPEGYEMGAVNYCQASPQFIASLNFSQPVLDTTQEFAVGLLVRDLADDGRLYQHETWDDAGKIGPFTIDWLGNIYAASAPVISQELNPVAEQNKIFVADTQTGAMSQLVDLPWPLPPAGSNPFGAVGLTYDCETDTLYAASVAGSTAQDEVGVIYQLHPQTGEILSQLENQDALGIGIFKAADGKRLYFGAGRTPEVYSVLLAADGRFRGEPRLEFSLAELANGTTNKAHRIQFAPDNQMIVKTLDFNYSLQASTRRERDIYTFQYDAENDDWLLRDVTSE